MKKLILLLFKNISDELTRILKVIITGIIVFILWNLVGYFIIPFNFKEIWMINGSAVIFIYIMHAYWKLVRYCWKKKNYLPITIPVGLYILLWILVLLGF